MKFAIISIPQWGGFTFYLETHDHEKRIDVHKNVAQVAKSKFAIPTLPQHIKFKRLGTCDDPRDEKLLDMDLWITKPRVTLETPASTHAHIAGKTFTEIHEIADRVLAQLVQSTDQPGSAPARGEGTIHTATTLCIALKNLTPDGLAFLNNWLENEAALAAIRTEQL